MRNPSFVLSLVLIAACGGGAEPTTPAPTPNPQPTATVSSIVVSGDSATLVPAQSWQLTAQALDASGVALAGRTISWSSSTPAVVAVSSEGRVSAVAPGRALVVATSDGKADTASVLVLDGAVIGPTGGSASLPGGAARVTIPAGVLAVDRAISIAPIATPVADPRLVPGTAHEFGPSGAFAAPVTLALLYDPVRVPAGMPQAALRIHRLTNGAWVEVPGSTVDTVSRTVSAPTGSFSAYAVLARVLGLETTISLSKAGSTCSQPGRCGITGSFVWTVPADVYQATFDLYGASGGGWAGAGLGGRGGRTTATIAVYPGERLQIRLGSAGNFLSAFNGGGRGGDGGPLFDGAGVNEIRTRDGRAGGGATDVLRRGAPLELNAPGLSGRILVAGGGGGDGGPSIRPVDLTRNLFAVDDPGAKGGAGGFVGSDGASGRGVVIDGDAYSAATGGSGGGQTAYGAGGASSRTPGGRTLTPGAPGTLLNGGGPGGTMTDPIVFTFSNTRGAGGGGGGGGWFGGGGGGPSWEYDQTGGGGGGGSSYGPAGAEFLTGIHVGDGKATITFTPSPGRTPTVITTTVTPASPTSQQSVTVSAVLTLAPPLSGPAAGTLRLVVDNQPVPGAALQVDAAGRVTFAPQLLTVGNHTIAVVFDGTNALGASAGTVDLSVRP
jgi:Bacterial Ig-like domain (group 3)/Bacterial Ig-like domain (group 2)/Glycine rich protein